jgi:uncharacterized membrane protein
MKVNTALTNLFLFIFFEHPFIFSNILFFWTSPTTGWERSKLQTAYLVIIRLTLIIFLFIFISVDFFQFFVYIWYFVFCGYSLYICAFLIVFLTPLPTFPWTHLKHSLYTLKLEDNPLVFSPPKIIEASTEAIQTYLEEQLMWYTYR